MLKSVKISVNDLEAGMFVSALDRPWLGTPFVTQGFMIESQAQIDQLRRHCEYIYIDRRRSAMVAYNRRESLPKAEKDTGGPRRDRPRIPLQKIFEGRQLKPYVDTAAWEEEFPKADNALRTLRGDIDQIFDEVTEGDKLDMIRLRQSVAPIVDSIGRNPDACLWVTRLKRHDRYTYQHSLGAAIWAVSLGRQMGLPRQDLRSLSMGCMLMDVGKLRIDPELLRTDRPLTLEQTAEMAGHVQHGLDILDECGVINQDVIDMVAHHHERHDGSGYPQGLASNAIPPFARIAGVVDTYDAITSQREYADPVSPSDAIKILYNARDIEFQAEIVESFIQAVGLYPAGTLVELSSGEVAVVVAEYRTRRLRPKVMVLLDHNKQRLEEARIVDLYAIENDPNQSALSIRRSLDPAAFGIDLSKIPFRELAV